MTYLLLVIGFLLLVKGADWFVEGSSSLAKTIGVPSVIIGLTIVAMGTSAPEASVSIHAALIENNDIAISNIIGSNIFNLLIVVGICAIMKPFHVNKDILKRDLPVNIFISVLLCVLLLDGQLKRMEGFLLLIGMMIYIFFMIYSAMNNREMASIKTLSLSRSFIYIIVGLMAVIYGGDLVVNQASTIAMHLGLSQNFIGLTIVAIGTSLPELVTSIVATRKNESELALGNAVGSNIFNILFILGASAMMSPLHVLFESICDGMILILTTVILYIFASSKEKISYKEGMICIFFYLCYMLYLFIR